MNSCCTEWGAGKGEVANMPTVVKVPSAAVLDINYVALLLEKDAGGLNMLVLSIPAF